MSHAAILLVLVSAVTHVAWNAVGKRQQPSASFFVWALVAGLLALSPCLWLYGDRLGLITGRVWSMLVLTGLCQAFYFAMLAAAYRRGDMSLAYPIARAMPVIMVLTLSFSFGHSQDITRGCLIGVGLILAGCVLLPLKSFEQFRLSSYFNSCCLCALLAAIGTAGYMFTDDIALRELRDLRGESLSGPGWALLYALLQVVSTLFWLLLYVLCNPDERGQIRAVFRTSRYTAALVGVGIYAAYSMVLVAMTVSQNVSYVVAFRQLSIPLGAALGMAVFKEPSYPLKFLGVGAVFSGVVLVGLG